MLGVKHRIQEDDGKTRALGHERPSSVIQVRLESTQRGPIHDESGAYRNKKYYGVHFLHMKDLNVCMRNTVSAISANSEFMRKIAHPRG